MYINPTKLSFLYRQTQRKWKQVHGYNDNDGMQCTTCTKNSSEQTEVVVEVAGKGNEQQAEIMNMPQAYTLIIVH